MRTRTIPASTLQLTPLSASSLRKPTGLAKAQRDGLCGPGENGREVSAQTGF
jgi:hypothetical protein